MPDRLIYFVVGDRGLDAGNGTYVQTLEQMRDRLLRVSRLHSWTLVISIHGSQDIVATQGGFLRNPSSPGVYDASAIDRIFNQHSQFGQWRRANGPSRVVLNACQVTMQLEGVILRALLRPGSAQAAQGLGAGCRPETTVIYLQYNGRDIRRRVQWASIQAAERTGPLRQLEQLNQRYGYFGAPRIPNSQVLDYYFDEEPLGGWPVVEVTHNRRGTNIPFFNRAQHTRFLRMCSGHIGSLPGRTATVPPPPSP